MSLRLLFFFFRLLLKVALLNFFLCFSVIFLQKVMTNIPQVFTFTNYVDLSNDELKLLGTDEC